MVRPYVGLKVRVKMKLVPSYRLQELGLMRVTEDSVLTVDTFSDLYVEVISNETIISRHLVLPTKCLTYLDGTTSEDYRIVSNTFLSDLINIDNPDYSFKPLKPSIRSFISNLISKYYRLRYRCIAAYRAFKAPLE